MADFGFFKVVETDTGKTAIIDNYLSEEWAEGCGEGAFWLVDAHGSPVVCDSEGDSIVRPPYHKFEVRRGTELEAGWDRIIYEGDHVLFRNADGTWTRGTVRYGKYFSQKEDLTLHIGFYIDWPVGVELDKALGGWLLRSASDVKFISPDEYEAYMPYVEARKPNSPADVNKRNVDAPSQEGFLDVPSEERYMDAPSEEEIREIFCLEAAQNDPDIKRLLDLRENYQPGDKQTWEEIFKLLNKIAFGAKYHSVCEFMDALDAWFPDALDILAVWNANRKDIWELLGIMDS